MSQYENLQLSGEAFEQTALGRTDIQLNQPSNCDDWSVRNLLEHMVHGCRIATAIAHGAPAASARSIRKKPIAGDIFEALSAAIAEQYRVLTNPEISDTVVHHPISDMTVSQLIDIRILEFVVHQWDLRTSLGITTDTTPLLAEVAWAVMEPLTEIASELDVFGTGSKGDLPPAASPLDRLLDATGR